MINVQELKNIPITDVIGQTFTIAGSGNTLTTEEHDSLQIFVNTNSFSWFSQTSKDGKPVAGDVIDWVRYIHDVSFKDAIKMLSGKDAVTLKSRKVLPAKPVDVAPSWKDAEWQRKAHLDLEAAQDALWNEPSKGQSGIDWLESRAIRRDMFIAFGLGYGMAWNAKAKKEMPAIFIPWQNKMLTGIKYRFLGVDKDDNTALRFGMLKGSKTYLFGLQHCMEAEPGQLKTLFLVEGELNAISIFQEVYGNYPCDVISFGAQTFNKQVKGMIAAVAMRYQQVIVWADEESAARAVNHALPSGLRKLAVSSPGGKDANDWLVDGSLGEMVFSMIRKAEEQENG